MVISCMTQLYTTYADLYHKMYQSFIDYDEEYQFYKELLDKNGVKNILEILIMPLHHCLGFIGTDCSALDECIRP